MYRLGALLGLAGLILMQLALAGSELYRAYADRGGAPLDVRQQAARIAVTLAPWSPWAHETFGRLLLQGHEALSGGSEYANALRWAPMDAYLWDGSAAASAARDDFSENFVAAVRRANTLAPTTPTIQAWHSTVALRSWPWVSASVRETFLPSLRYEAAYERAALTEQVVQADAVPLVCRNLVSDLDLAGWCASHAAPAVLDE